MPLQRCPPLRTFEAPAKPARGKNILLVISPPGSTVPFLVCSPLPTLDIHSFDEQDFLWSWDINHKVWRNECNSMDLSNITNLPAPRGEVASAFFMPAIVTNITSGISSLALEGQSAGDTSRGNSGSSKDEGSAGNGNVVYGSGSGGRVYGSCGQVVVYGGYSTSIKKMVDVQQRAMSQFCFLSDTYLFDVATKTWKVVHCSNWPEKR